MTQTKIGIIGCDGRMGRENIKAVSRDARVSLAGGTEPAGSSAIGKDLGDIAGIGRTGLLAGDDVIALAKACDVLIEFTTSEATLMHARQIAGLGTPLVIGTTGFDADQRAKLIGLAEKTAILLAPNMSLGVNLLLAVVEQVAGALDEDFDAEVLEMHHRRKIDAPSGTALAIGGAIDKGRGGNREVIRNRDGLTGARPGGAIGYATLRGGDVIGDHTAIFAGEGERIEISHKASSRDIYANGAVKAAIWLSRKPAGFYSMRDVLGMGS